MGNLREALKIAIVELLDSRKPGSSICPSEAARLVFGTNWREQMQLVRDVAIEMRSQEQLEICQKGHVIDPLTTKGPIRVRLP